MRTLPLGQHIDAVMAETERIIEETKQLQLDAQKAWERTIAKEPTPCPTTNPNS